VAVEKIVETANADDGIVDEDEQFGGLAWIL